MKRVVWVKLVNGRWFKSVLSSQYDEAKAVATARDYVKQDAGLHPYRIVKIIRRT